MKKSIRMLMGIFLHPFKALIFKVSGKRKYFTMLAANARNRAYIKAFERRMYLSSLTGTSVHEIYV